MPFAEILACCKYRRRNHASGRHSNINPTILLSN